MITKNLDDTAVSELATKIVNARRLYGADSSYVIGMLAGMEMLLDDVNGSSGAVHDRVLEIESGKVRVGKPEAETSRVGGQSALVENSWITGSVKWFNNDKGYGFISTDAETDVFVHWRDISSWDRSLTQGDEVEFMVAKTAKGFQAINVMKGEANAGADESEADAGVGDARQVPPRSGDNAADERSAPEHNEGNAPTVFGSETGSHYSADPREDEAKPGQAQLETEIHAVAGSAEVGAQNAGVMRQEAGVAQGADSSTESQGESQVREGEDSPGR